MKEKKERLANFIQQNPEEFQILIDIIDMDAEHAVKTAMGTSSPEKSVSIAQGMYQMLMKYKKLISESLP